MPQAVDGRAAQGVEIQSPGRSQPGFPQSIAHFFSGPWPLVIVLLLAVLPYLGVLRNDFTYTYDDRVLILGNPLVHTFQHWKELLTTTLFANQGAQGGAPYYRPVAMLIFLLCYQLFGPAAFGFHLVSLLLNMAAVGILFVLAERLLRDRVAAFMAAALFALHPIHVEAVAWISAVTDIEVTVFCLLTFWFYLRWAEPRKIWPFAGMAAAFILAVFSKEQALLLPLLATIYEHFYRSDRLQTTLLQKVQRYASLWVIAFGYLWLRVKLMGSFAHPTQVHPLTLPDALLSALALVGEYAGKLLWPVHLNAFYPFHASTRIVDPRVLMGACTLALSACLFVVLWRRARCVSFGVLWLSVMLLPVLNARWMSAYVLGERYLYLPSVGFCLVAGWAGARLWQVSCRRPGVLPVALAGAACLLAVLGVFRISWRVLDWRNDVTLYTRTLAAQPDDYRLHDALGLAYWLRGNAQAAESEWRETLRLEPHSVQTLNLLGALYARQRKFDAARTLLLEALQLNPDDADAHLNLGAVYAETGRLDAAEEQFRAAVRLEPMNFQAHNLLGKLYYDSNRLGEAEGEFRQSLQCEPNVAAYDYLGYIYERESDATRAEEVFQTALELNPLDSHAHFHLGLIYGARGQKAQAIEQLQAALAEDPHNPEIVSALQKLRQ